MTRFRKAGLSITLILAISIAVFAGYVYHVLRASLPDHTAAFTQHLDEPVSVLRDDRGVPRIQAQTIDTLAYLQGYVHADERIWQMEFHRRVVQGRLAETLGGELEGTDRFLRTLGLHRIAHRIVEKTSPEGRRVIRNYIDGVNDRIQKGRLPPEFRILGITPELWTEADVAGVLALMSYDLGTNWQEESIRLSLRQKLDETLFDEIMPPYEDWDTPVIWSTEQASRAGAGAGSVMDAGLDRISPFLPKLGSNSWVVSPDNWAGDHALLANDPHLNLGLPSIWFENSLEIPGEFAVYGWSIPGTPGVVIGHNNRIAWGMTNIGDAQDLFLERRHPDNPLLFQHGDDWLEARVIRDEIRVKGRNEPEVLEIVITKNGPLVSESPPMSLKWTAYHVEKSTVDAIIGINRAHDWDAFRDALAHFTLPVQNIVYADIDGNIGFRTAGMLPVRKKGKGLFPSPGWDPEYGWTGFIPHEELPELFNPPQGYVITANHRVAGDDYPHVIAIDDASPYRMMRIEEILGSRTDLTLADMKILQTDWYNKHAAERLPLLLERVSEHAGNYPDRYDDAQVQGLSLLHDWLGNPVSDSDLPAPAIYAAWYRNFMEDVFREQMGVSLYHRFLDRGYLAYKALDYLLIKEESPWFEQGLGHVLAQSYRRTMDELALALGPDPDTWQWRDLQTITLGHIFTGNRWLSPWFDRGPFPYGGDYETVGRAAYRLNDPFNVRSAAGLRFIAVMRPGGIDAHAVIAGGQSGHFMADHYDDQVGTWLEGGYYRLEVKAP